MNSLQCGNSNDILQFIIKNDIVNINDVQSLMESMKRKELLSKHPYKIWQGNDSRWRTYLPDKKKGRVLKKRNSQKEIEDVIIDYWTEQLENPTVKEVFEEWNNRRLELGKIAEATHLRNKQVFNRHYMEFGNRKIKSLSVEEIEDFLEEQIPEYNLTAKAFSNLKTITRGFLKRAKKCKYIDFSVEDIFNDLDTSDSDFNKVIKEDYQEVFDEDEMSKMIKYLEEHLDTQNIGILFMFVTGIRVGELVTLKHNVFDGNTFKIRRTETRYLDKNKKYVYKVKEYPKSEAGVRTVVVPEDYAWICAKIRTLNPFGEYIFVNKSGERMTTNCIRNRLKRLCEKLIIYHKSPHKIRKTYGTILFDNNVDKRLILDQMGHADILVGETHYHRNRKTIEKKSNILSSIPEFKAQ